MLIKLLTIPLLVLSKSADAVLLLSLCKFSSIFAVGFVAFVFISRRYKTVLKSKAEIIREQCQEFIAELLFGEDDNKSLLEEKKSFLLEKKFRRQILLQEIIKLHASIQGEEAKKLEDFYKNSSLYKMSDLKILSSNKNIVIGGLLELVEMNVTEYIPKLQSLVKETLDTELKNYLITAIIKLDPAKGLNILLEVDYFLTDWFQLVILKELDDLNFTDFPDKNLWLSKGKSLAIFGERLYKVKKSIERPEVNSLYTADNQDNITLESTIDVESALLEIYYNESEQVQKEIENTLSIFKSGLLSDKNINRSDKNKILKVLGEGAFKDIFNKTLSKRRNIIDILLSWSSKIGNKGISKK